MRWNWPQPDWANITYDAARPALSANELLQAAIGDEGRAADFEGLDLARADQLVERRSRNARELDRRGDADADRFARQGLEFGTYRRRCPFVILERRPLGHDFIRERMKVRSLSRKAANIVGPHAATRPSIPQVLSEQARSGEK